MIESSNITDKRERTCCFTGHRKLPPHCMPELQSALKDTIESLIHKGVRYFGAGGARGFDTFAALAVIELRKQYPQIKLILVLPCRTQTLKWKRDEIERYEWIKSQADKSVYTSDEYYEGCMNVRNRHLVNYSRYCICFLLYTFKSGTAFTVRYATENGLTIINLAERL